MENQINSLVQELLSIYKTVGTKIAAVAESSDYTEKLKRMEELKATLGKIKNIEGQLFPIRDRFLENGGNLSSETKGMIDQSIAIVSELLPKLGELENEAKVDRENMAPKIHDGVRALQMQSAYSSNQ